MFFHAHFRIGAVFAGFPKNTRFFSGNPLATGIQMGYNTGVYL